MKYLAFTDGSYKKFPDIGEVYASAAIVAPENSNEWRSITGVYNDEYIKHRNVAGEVRAVLLLCEYCLTLPDCTELVIGYDYKGLQEWLAGTWKTNTPLSKLYVEYIKEYVSPKIKISMVHTAGHTGVQGNETVDNLCREAIKEYVNKQRS